MSNFIGYGTLTSDGNTEEISCRGWSTLSAHLLAGSGTLTWQMKGPDGVWRDIYGGSSGDVVLSFVDSNMTNVNFGSDVKVRGVASSSSSVQWAWQIMGNPINRE